MFGNLIIGVGIVLSLYYLFCGDVWKIFWFCDYVMIVILILVYIILCFLLNLFMNFEGK